LDAGDYSVTLRSAEDGFKHPDGGLLDGDNDGSAGGDFVDQFTIGAVEPVGISLPDFARGPGQSVHVPANDTGLPLTFEDNRSGGNAVESISLTISYDSTLLNTVDATLGPDAPADSVLSVDTDTPGQISLSVNRNRLNRAIHRQRRWHYARFMASPPRFLTESSERQSRSVL
jgi:hypothetical protein